MKEIKKFKVLKGFTVFFTVGVVLSLLFYFLFGSGGTQTWVLNILLHFDSTLTVEKIDGWADWGILSGCIFGVFQLIFMSCSFSTALKAIRKGRARTVQASVYMNTPKEEKLMKKEAKRASKEEAKMKTKEEKRAIKKAKADAKLAKKAAKKVSKPLAEVTHHSTKKEVTEEKPITPAPAPINAKSKRIDDILKDMK